MVLIRYVNMVKVSNINFAKIYGFTNMYMVVNVANFKNQLNLTNLKDIPVWLNYSEVKNIKYTLCTEFIFVFCRKVYGQNTKLLMAEHTTTTLSQNIPVGRNLMISRQKLRYTMLEKFFIELMFDMRCVKTLSDHIESICSFFFIEKMPIDELLSAQLTSEIAFLQFWRF